MAAALGLVAATLTARALPGAAPAAPQSAPQAALDRIWEGVREAEATHASACGTLVETRTSPLLAKPLVLQGTFCSAGTNRFRIDYRPPDGVRIVYNEGIVNVSLDGGKRTEVVEVGSAVDRTRDYFSGPRAQENLLRDFSVTAQESSELYSLVLLPKSGRFRQRLARVSVALDRKDFLPRRLEIEGRNGITSRFDIRVDRPGPADDSWFKVYHPR